MTAIYMYLGFTVTGCMPADSHKELELTRLWNAAHSHQVEGRLLEADAAARLALAVLEAPTNTILPARPIDLVNAVMQVDDTKRGENVAEGRSDLDRIREIQRRIRIAEEALKETKRRPPSPFAGGSGGASGGASGTASSKNSATASNMDQVTPFRRMPPARPEPPVGVQEVSPAPKTEDLAIPKGLLGRKTSPKKPEIEVGVKEEVAEATQKGWMKGGDQPKPVDGFVDSVRKRAEEARRRKGVPSQPTFKGPQRIVQDPPGRSAPGFQPASPPHDPSNREMLNTIEKIVKREADRNSQELRDFKSTMEQRLAQLSHLIGHHAAVNMHREDGRRIPTADRGNAPRPTDITPRLAESRAKAESMVASSSMIQMLTKKVSDLAKENSELKRKIEAVNANTGSSLTAARRENAIRLTDEMLARALSNGTTVPRNGEPELSQRIARLAAENKALLSRIETTETGFRSSLANMREQMEELEEQFAELQKQVKSPKVKKKKK